MEIDSAITRALANRNYYDKKKKETGNKCEPLVNNIFIHVCKFKGRKISSSMEKKSMKKVYCL